MVDNASREVFNETVNTDEDKEETKTIIKGVDKFPLDAKLKLEMTNKAESTKNRQHNVKYDQESMVVQAETNNTTKNIHMQHTHHINEEITNVCQLQ